MTKPLRSVVAVLSTLTLVAAACSGGGSAETTTTSVAQASTTTSTASTTTTTVATTTTTAATTTVATFPSYVVAINLPDAESALRSTVGEFYNWVGNRNLDPPPVPEGLLDHAAGALVEGDVSLTGTTHVGDVAEGWRVAVVMIGDDVVLAADDGSGWAVVGAHLAGFGLDPWFGEPVRHILVIGTDARPGESQQLFRADSIHVLSSNAAAGGGSVIGFPRDSYVEASYGFDKYTHVNVEEGSEAMVRIAADITGLPVEGFLITGFLNFERMVNDFGGVMVNVPFGMADKKSKAYLSAGLQRLWGANALAFTRNRSIRGSDFTRSLHQGILILGALDGVLERDITRLPELLKVLYDYTWTDLPLADLVTVAASAFYVDPDAVRNVVLEGSIQLIDRRSVVVLDDEVNNPIFEDAADGMLESTTEE